MLGRVDAGGEVTHASGGRFGLLVDGLHARPEGWSYEAIQSELRISTKSLDRYVAKLRDLLVDESGRPRVEVVRRAGRRVVRLSASPLPSAATAYQAATFHLARTVLRFLGGTVLESSLEEAWEKLAASVPGEQRAWLADLDRKFHSIPFLEKEYRGADAHLDVVVRALVRQRRLRVDYAGRHGEGRVHEFDPYTLAVHRGALYLIGRSHLYRRVIYLAVDRIRSLALLADRFVYPERYSPRRHTRGIFGLIDGAPTRVELLIHDRDTALFLRERRLGLGERFRARADGTTLLTMRVRGTVELAGWILGFGPRIEVRRPRALREQVAAALAAGAERYAAASPGLAGDRLHGMEPPVTS